MAYVAGKTHHRGHLEPGPPMWEEEKGEFTPRELASQRNVAKRVPRGAPRFKETKNIMLF